MPLWLNELTGNEHGWLAWDLDLLGFATWAPTRSAVLARVPERLSTHRAWLAGHGLAGSTAADQDLTVAQVVTGNEAAFERDLGAAEPAEIESCLTLLAHTRRDLLDVVTPAPEASLDWDPPYADYAPWARWRTVRQVLMHVADTEDGYYLPAIGFEGPAPDEEPSRSSAAPAWLERLESARATTRRVLSRLASAGETDRVRLHDSDETWTVRKVLRRLVWHERLHTKSIDRVLRLWWDRHGADRPSRGRQS